jgi:predicted nucleic acid-binding Zn ribbon protein
VIQPAGVIFKGSGFYITDNRHKSTLPSPKGAKGHESEKAEEKKSTTKANGKTSAEGTTASSSAD